MHSELPLVAPAIVPVKEKADATLRMQWIVLTVVAVVCVAGINFIGWLKESPLCFPDTANWFNAFFVVTAQTEPAGLMVVLGFCVIVAVWWLRKSARPLFLSRITLAPRKIVYGLVFTHLLVAAVGTWMVTHHYPLAADENMPDFQAKIFLSGKLQADIPEDLRFAAHSLTPLQAVRTADNAHWNQGYLPVYAAIRAPFLALHLQTLVNPLLGAWSVLSLAAVIRLIWPGQPWLDVAGAALLALSPQTLINGMTSYAMPAHLALNLFWLWLYLQPQKRRFWLAPFVGVLAVGLHSPFVHALFVLPFLCRLLWERHWKAVLVFGVVYLAGCFGCWYWWHLFSPGNANPSDPLLVWQPQRLLLTQPLNLLNLISWSALPFSCLALIGLRSFRHLPAPVRDGTVAFLLTFTFYAFISFDQGLGWGNRYCYGVLGCLTLLAVAGLQKWISQSTDHRPLIFTIAGMVLTAALLLPLRCWQVEKFIRPYAATQAAFRKMDADIVLYDPRTAWYSSELRRNDPFLTQRPLIINILTLTPEQSAQLKVVFPKCRFVTTEELTARGLFTKAWPR